MSRKPPKLIIEEIFPIPEEAKYKSLEEAQTAAKPSIAKDLTIMVRAMMEQGSLIVVEGRVVPNPNFDRTQPLFVFKKEAVAVKEMPIRNRRLVTRKREQVHKRGDGWITTREWMDLKRRWDYTCLCCGKREPEIKLTLDHVVPISKGGENEIENIQPLCKRCNIKKHVKNTDYRKKAEWVKFLRGSHR